MSTFVRPFFPPLLLWDLFKRLLGTGSGSEDKERERQLCSRKVSHYGSFLVLFSTPAPIQLHISGLHLSLFLDTRRVFTLLDASPSSSNTHIALSVCRPSSSSFLHGNTAATRELSLWRLCDVALSLSLCLSLSFVLVPHFFVLLIAASPPPLRRSRERRTKGEGGGKASVVEQSV